LLWKGHLTARTLCVCVWWMAETKLVTSVKRKFRMTYEETAPPGNSFCDGWNSSKQ
jgi:hypothetical protein